MVTEIPTYYNVKVQLCKDQGKSVGIEQNPEDGLKIVFLEEVLWLGSNLVSLQINDTDDSRKIILVFAGESGEYLLRNGTSFLLDCKLNNCPRQFAKLYSLCVGLGSTMHGKYIYPNFFNLFYMYILYCIITYIRLVCTFTG